MSQNDPLNRPARTVRRRRGGLLGPLLRGHESAPPPPPHPEPESLRPVEPELSANPPAAWVPAETEAPEPTAAVEPEPATTMELERATHVDPERAAVEEHRSALSDEPSELTIPSADAVASWQAVNGNGAAAEKPAPDAVTTMTPDPTTWIPFEEPHASHGTAFDNGHHAAYEWLPPDERPPSAPDTELEHRRAAAVKAYCDRFIDPTQAESLTAQALDLFGTRMRRRPNADEDSANLELLRITRTVAASAPMSETAADGWRDELVHSLAAERHGNCVRASELLAARANDEIEEAGRDELQDHLRECESCRAVERGMLDAEQAFVVALEADEPIAVALEADEPPPVPAEEPRVVVSDPRKAAVEAYCSAVCGATAVAAAADAWSSFEAEAGGLAEGSADAEELRLAALTRAVAARHLAAEIADDPGRSADCVATPRLLAARVNDLIDEQDLDALDQHLRRCSACREVQARMTNAEQVWARELGHPMAAPVALPALGQRRRRVRPALIAVAAAIAGVLLAIVLVSGSGTGHPSATKPPKIAQPVAITSTATTTATTHTARHHVAAAHKVRHRRTTPTTAAATTPTTTSPATLTQAAATTPPQTTTPQTTPTTYTPAPPPPPSSPPPTTTQTLTNQGSAVGPAPAPQGGIKPKH